MKENYHDFLCRLLAQVVKDYLRFSIFKVYVLNTAIIYSSTIIVTVLKWGVSPLLGLNSFEL